MRFVGINISQHLDRHAPHLAAGVVLGHVGQDLHRRRLVVDIFEHLQDGDAEVGIRLVFQDAFDGGQCLVPPKVEDDV